MTDMNNDEVGIQRVEKEITSNSKSLLSRYQRKFIPLSRLRERFDRIYCVKQANKRMHERTIERKDRQKL